MRFRFPHHDNGYASKFIKHVLDEKLADVLLSRHDYLEIVDEHDEVNKFLTQFDNHTS